MSNKSVLDDFSTAYQATKASVMSLTEYLDLCKVDPTAYSTPAERMVTAIGEPEMVNTKDDPRWSRLFGNRTIRTYKAFADFFGIEEVVESIVNFFRFAAQGLEQSRQILYLLGPVGSAKSSLVERIKELYESQPIYVLAYEHPKTRELVHSPYFCSPLGLFSTRNMREAVSKKYKIPERYLNLSVGPWEQKRIAEFDGDINKFRVVKMFPSQGNQIAITNTEPGDENTQDISTLVGKVDIRKLEDMSQNDPDAYLWSGGLNITNQGILDFREMFKAKIKMLNPLLFAVQEHKYNGTENFGSIPYNGMVVSHSNESEWAKFKNNKDNEAFIDRTCLIKVPYCLRVDEEKRIYEVKALATSALANAPRAPHTLEMLAQFSVLTRLVEPDNSNLWSKMEVYNGKNLKEKDPRAKTYLEYRDDPQNRVEGFSGLSTRWAFKVLSDTFNADNEEVAANPIHLMRIIVDKLATMDLSEDLEKKYRSFITEHLKPRYLEFLDKEIRTAYMESYAEYGQNLFDRYVNYADNWSNDEEFFNADTGERLDREGLNRELEKIEKPAGIANPKDFRNEVVKYVLRHAAKNGKNPDWRSYEKLRMVIEKAMFSATSEILPVISFEPKGTEEDRKKHNDFITRMTDHGYTKKQVRILVDWYLKVSKVS